uniref:Uncharacterized protein n=1 Tax=Timema tahoe TaxID=61484 RepID=A0A7R9NY26_9NEOP|nr:unnamed protein product [Timema tahoe]
MDALGTIPSEYQSTVQKKSITAASRLTGGNLGSHNDLQKSSKGSYQATQISARFYYWMRRELRSCGLALAAHVAEG